MCRDGVSKKRDSAITKSKQQCPYFCSRSPVYIGDGNRFEITIDGWTVAKIYPSQYISALIPTGSRSVGIEGQSSLVISFLQGEKYFFKTYMSWVNFGIVIERINEEDFYKMVTAKNNEGQALYRDVSETMITK